MSDLNQLRNTLKQNKEQSNSDLMSKIKKGFMQSPKYVDPLMKAQTQPKIEVKVRPVAHKKEEPPGFPESYGYPEAYGRMAESDFPFKMEMVDDRRRATAP